MKPLGHRVSRFSQALALAPPLPGWASASITQHSSAPRTVGSPGWPRTPFISRPRPHPWHPAPSAAPRPFPGSPSPTPSPLRVAAHPSQKPQTQGELPQFAPPLTLLLVLVQPIKEANSAPSPEAANVERLRIHLLPS